MCYGYYAVYNLDTAEVDWIDRDDFRRLFNEGLIGASSDGFYYPKAMVGVISNQDGAITASPMRWDFIPRGYLAGEKQFSLKEMVKKKNSRAINPATGKKWGYDSYNARIESISTTWSFKESWREGKRCVMPTTAFKERPNMDGAPVEFKGREYKIELDGIYFLGGIWDRIERNGETLNSCTVITMDSKGHEKIQNIYHERHPLILTLAEAQEWLNPTTTLARANAMVHQLGGSHMEITEIPKYLKSA